MVSTSAGEEGIDLPSADLLVIWGNAASDIRFIQRLGRMMRKTGEGLKFATFVVTPESSDFDSFALGLAKAAETNVIDVEKTFGWDPEVLWPRTTWWHISELLRSNPTPLGEMAQALGVRDELAERIVKGAVATGRLFYIYDVQQMVVEAEKWSESWARDKADPSWWRRTGWNTATSMLGKMRQYRIYALVDDVEGLRQKYPSQFSKRDVQMLLLGRKTKLNRRARAKRSIDLGGGWIDEYGQTRGLKATSREGSYTILRGLWAGISPAEDLSNKASLLTRREDVEAICLSRRKSERLEYFFCPRTENVLRALVENAARFFELIDKRRYLEKSSDFPPAREAI